MKSHDLLLRPTASLSSDFELVSVFRSEAAGIGGGGGGGGGGGAGAAGATGGSGMSTGAGGTTGGASTTGHEFTGSVGIGGCGFFNNKIDAQRRFETKRSKTSKKDILRCMYVGQES